jgi:hypothetical protein
VYLIGQPVPRPKINQWVATLKKLKIRDVDLRIYKGLTVPGTGRKHQGQNWEQRFLEDLYVENESN